MTQRRFVFNLRPNGLLGWLVLALLAIPLALLSFFFFAAALVLAVMALVIAFVRIHWLKPKGKDAPRAPAVHGDVIDVEAVEVPASGRALTIDESSPRAAVERR